MKLKNMINEARQQWKVKDIIEMRKAHERVLKAMSTMDKALKNLEKVSNKNKAKPNGEIFTKEDSNMKGAFDKDILSANSWFWKYYKQYEKGGKAAFPDNWDY